jgi:hypothetical protein
MLGRAVPGESVSVTVGRGTGAIRGLVVDEEGQRIAGATIIASREDGAATTPSVVSAQDGTFVFNGLREGIYTVTVDHAPYAVASQRAIRLEQAESRSIERVVLLRAGALAVVCHSTRAREIRETLYARGEVVDIRTVAVTPESAPEQYDRIPLGVVRLVCEEQDTVIADVMGTVVGSGVTIIDVHLK